MKFYKKIFVCIFVLLLVFSTSSCKVKELKADVTTYSLKPFQFAFDSFDTSCSITIYTSLSQEECMYIGDNLRAIIDAYENNLSKTKEGSDIYDINHRTGDSVMITDLSTTLFEIAGGLYDWSNHKFDISAGTLTDLWDVKNRTTLPTDEEILEARKHCGNFAYTIEHDVDPEYIKSNRITFHGDPKTQYDFGALAKGLCADSLRATIEGNKDIVASIINLGGNVLCTGKLDDRKDGSFKIGVAKPFEPGEIVDTLEIVDKCVITSGNYQRYFKIDGDDRIYHHIIDPTDGYPVNNELNSVTIVSTNGLLGDYLSTACMLLGIENSKPLIDYCSKNYNDKNIQAIFCDKNNNVTKYPTNVNLK